MKIGFWDFEIERNSDGMRYNATLDQKAFQAMIDKFNAELSEKEECLALRLMSTEALEKLRTLVNAELVDRSEKGTP
jgi:uncharacterized protein YeaO (DUF488 family)